MLKAGLFLLTGALSAVLGQQVHLETMDASESWASRSEMRWSLTVSEDWDVLGPFPIHAREQQFLSPSFPLDLTKPVDYNARWPSSLADNGTVRWSRMVSDNGTLKVSFPEIRWESIRKTEGWAGLQHHAVLHTIITVHPPLNREPGPRIDEPRLLLDLKQGSYFTLLSHRTDNLEIHPEIYDAPRWHAGNIYAMNASPPNTVPFPTFPSPGVPTKYDLFVSGDYEIRLFGDPKTQGKEVPEQVISVSAKLEAVEDDWELKSSHNVVPDFVDGYAFGDAIGIGIRSHGGWWDITDVRAFIPSHTAPESQVTDQKRALPIQVDLLSQVRIAPTQTRIIPVRILQTAPFLDTNLHLKITAKGGRWGFTTWDVDLPVRHRPYWNQANFHVLVASYFYASLLPTAFLATPPSEETLKKPHPPILALHGAGVDIIDQPFWQQALPRQEKSWTIMPTGRTAWGLDWHGPSTQEAWATVHALSSILTRVPDGQRWSFPTDTRVLLLGHSNGGQGAWHMAARFPDRVIAVVPAAAYIKSQAYVPLIHARSAHFIDPALQAILNTALTPDDNDLFLSNLVDTPILAIHGGDDENVPVWHTRELVNTLKTWNPAANITFREDPGELHWYPTVFNNEEVQQFIHSTIEQSLASQVVNPRAFTLTTAVPSESGSLHGWSIEALKIPGRLARLSVKQDGGHFAVTTRNVHTFSIRTGPWDSIFDSKTLYIDGSEIHLTQCTVGDTQYLTLENGNWQVYHSSPDAALQPWGRMQRILSSSGPLTFIIPSESSNSILSGVLRIVHDLDVYHKLDATIIDATKANELLRAGQLGQGNLVTIGVENNAFSQRLLQDRLTAFHVKENTLHLHEKPITSTAMFLHPHPINPSGLAMIIATSTGKGLEMALRLFPIRTGVAVPDWIIIGDSTEEVGAAGLEGAGVWGHKWSWSKEMSSF